MPDDYAHILRWRHCYRIEGFCAPDPEMSMSGWGFGIYIDPAFVWHCLQATWPEGEHITEMIVENEKRMHSTPTYQHEPWRNNITFEELDGRRTAFAAHFDTLGNACGLDAACPGCSGTTIERVLADYPDYEPYEEVAWTPHNVDSCQQAAALLTQFLVWVQHVPHMFAKEPA